MNYTHMQHACIPIDLTCFRAAMKQSKGILISWSVACVARLSKMIDAIKSDNGNTAPSRTSLHWVCSMFFRKLWWAGIEVRGRKKGILIGGFWMLMDLYLCHQSLMDLFVPSPSVEHMDQVVVSCSVPTDRVKCLSNHSLSSSHG